MFPTLKKGEGEATFHEGREENLHLGKKVGNCHVSQQLLSMIAGVGAFKWEGGVIGKGPRAQDQKT